MSRKTRVKQYGQGGRTRGRHKKMSSRETKTWLRISKTSGWISP